MTSLVVLGLAALAVLATTILALAFAPRPRNRRNFGISDYASGPDPVHGLDTPHPDWRRNISFEKIDPPTNERRVFGKRLPK
jgi:hypothetical protein